MCHTKLFKILNKQYCFLLISISLFFVACSPQNESKKEPCFLAGKWKFTAIETNESQGLDSVSQKIYHNQLNSFLTNSTFTLFDSTYIYQLGDEVQKGLWRYHPTDSVLSLKPYAGSSQKKGIQLFNVLSHKNHIQLHLKNSKSGEYWVLKK